MLRRATHRLLSEAAATAPAAPASSGGIQFWHVVLGLSAPIGYYVVRNQRKTAALRDASTELISPSRAEAEDLVERANLSRDQAEMLQEEMRLHEQVSAEELGNLVYNIGSKIEPWDVLCLFRNSPADQRHRLDSAEASVGLAILARGSELEFAWRSVQPDLNPLSFDAFAALLDRMLRTGHYSAASLLRQTRLMPPEWSILSGRGVAEKYYAALGKNPDEPISFDEFLTKATGLSSDGDLSLWYLQKKKAEQKKEAEQSKEPENKEPEK